MAELYAVATSGGRAERKRSRGRDGDGDGDVAAGGAPGRGSAKGGDGSGGDGGTAGNAGPGDGTTGATKGGGARSGPGRGYGHYASYHALWHLREIGVVPDLGSFASEGWDAAKARLEGDVRPTRVALIDTSVAYGHPNLVEAIRTDLMIDFFSRRLGTFPCPGSDPAALAAALAAAPDKAAALGDGRLGALFAELVADLPTEHAEAGRSESGRRRRVFPATSPTFSGHGTAMAGLIGARPKGPDDVHLVPTRHIGGSHGPTPPAAEASGFPYAGVDPFCEIVPISTSFDPDPEQLVLAMLYAWLIEADVIVLARDFPDPLGSPITGAPGPEPGMAAEAERAALEAAYPAELPEEERALWAALRQLTLDMSKTVPIVCAAGNGGDETLILPAALADPGNGIVAVGARAATGRRAGYSTTGPAGGARITIYAPSGDGERLDRDLRRLDTADPGFRPEDHGADYLDTLGVQYPALGAPPEVGPATFSTQEIITTDVPGAAGYNSSTFARTMAPGGGVLDHRSYYCRFSGTSAAAAIVAGTLSLAISAGRIDRSDAAAVKARLRGPAAATDDEAATPFLAWSAFGPP